jgi:hypothetical protein
MDVNLHPSNYSNTMKLKDLLNNHALLRSIRPEPTRPSNPSWKECMTPEEYDEYLAAKREYHRRRRQEHGDEVRARDRNYYRSRKETQC